MSKWLSKNSSLRWRWLLPVAVALAAFHFSPVGATLDRAFFDFASRHPARAQPPPDGAAIVLFDTAALAALSEQGLGGWPPPRITFAALIAGLERAGASRIVLDLLFLDHSASGEQDALLGALAAGLPNVVLARTPDQTPVFWDETFITENPALFASTRMGVVESSEDPDGVLRRYVFADSLAAAAAGQRVPFGKQGRLPLRDAEVRPSEAPLPPAAQPVAARGLPTPPLRQTTDDTPRGPESPSYNGSASAGSDSDTLLRWFGGLEQLRAHTDRLPVLSAARFIIAGLPLIERAAEAAPDLQPADLARAVSAAPPLNGPGFDEVRGRIVFVGANADGTFDQKPFAIGGLEPGVLFHWTAWANLAGDGFIRELPPWASPVLALGCVALLAVVGVRRSGIALPVTIAAGVAFASAGLAYVGHSSGWFFPPATPMAAAGFALLGVVAERFWIERRRREEVQAMFGSYVAPDIVELLVRDPAAIRLGGERRDATVFFCDLAGFTDLSEQVSPEELLALINGYLQQTSECLMMHGAYVDKYIGDAVMAVFGAPKGTSDHALSGCRAALAVQRLLAERNVELAATHGRMLGLRIGLNSGEMIVGNVGSERKKNYTVLGDAVNLASRLEGANKEFGTRILVGDATARAVGDQLVLRPLTGLRVKGRQTAVPVFELIGAPDEITPAQRAFLEAYATAHELYTRRQFAEAAAAFTRAADLDPRDRMTGKLLAESQRLALHPPPPDWLPIVSLDTK